MARFISGVNNHVPELERKQNLFSARFSVSGECRVVFITARDIAKGEQLYYDYNGGADSSLEDGYYPTSDFVLDIDFRDSLRAIKAGGCLKWSLSHHYEK